MPDSDSPLDSPLRPATAAPAKIPPISKQHAPQFRGQAHREFTGHAFSDALADSDGGALTYHRVRPDYPGLDSLLDSFSQRDSLGSEADVAVADLGAGTGKLTEDLAKYFPTAEIFAVEPSDEMRTVLAQTLEECGSRAHVVDGTAEHTTLADASVGLVASAQTWHWVNVSAASQEAARILRKSGHLLLVWNTLDVSVPWVHRLSRIMHAGDVLAEGFYPEVGPQFSLADELRHTWTDQLIVDEIILLTRTRSYWLNAKDSTREKVESNLRWYLLEHLGYEEDATIALPYRLDAFLYRLTE